MKYILQQKHSKDLTKLNPSCDLQFSDGEIIVPTKRQEVPKLNQL